jgi:Cu-processing system permease protein
VFDQGQTVTAGLLNALLLLNPTDAYRLLNLGSGSVRDLAGMSGVAEDTALAPAVLVTALALWALIPLSAATMVFSRREL